MTASWVRRGHSVECWRVHSRCALASARDLLETRAQQTRAQAVVFRTALDVSNRDQVEAPEQTIALARMVLEDFVAALPDERPRTRRGRSA